MSPRRPTSSSSADGKWYTIHDDTTGTPGVIKASGAWSGSSTLNLPRKTSDRATFWSDYSEIDLEDGSTIRTVNPLDWLSESAGGEKLYDRVNHGIWNHASDRSPARPARRLPRRRPDLRQPGIPRSRRNVRAATGGNIVTREGSVELEPGQAKSVVRRSPTTTCSSAARSAGTSGIPSEATANGSTRSSLATSSRRSSGTTMRRRCCATRPTSSPTASRARQASRFAWCAISRRRCGSPKSTAGLGRIWGRGEVKLGPRFCELEDGDWGEW
jgi:hypothetical protein